MTEVRSPYTSNKPAYRYLRPADRLPTYDQLAADPVLKVRLFNPTGSGTWWVAAYDPDTGIAYGVSEIQEREAGSFDMAELVAYRGKWGLPIERDLHYSPVRMSALLPPRRRDQYAVTVRDDLGGTYDLTVEASSYDEARAKAVASEAAAGQPVVVVLVVGPVDESLSTAEGRAKRARDER